MVGFRTDQGTPNEIVWGQTEQQVRRIPWDPNQVPVEGAANTGVPSMPLQPPVPGVSGDLQGVYTAKWFLTQGNGLTVTEVKYNPFLPTGQKLPPHRVVEFMQWSNLRLIVDQGPTAGQVPPGRVLPITMSASLVEEAWLATEPGIRQSDLKVFAWGAGIKFSPFKVQDGLDPNVTYTVRVQQSFLFGAPATDQEPSAKAVLVKVYPLLTVKVESSDALVSSVNPPLHPPPSFAADLKLVFAPRLTRPDQHRPDPQFPLGDSRINTNVVNLFCDTNSRSRPIPGTGINKPFWPNVFDYGNPEITSETAFDAVVFPRSDTNLKDCTITGPMALSASGVPPLTFGSNRAPGQGEFDNLHIHPFVGYDDPRSAFGTTDQSHALVEAPLAADEVVHLHWRWGGTIPDSAVAAGHPELVPSFMGYTDVPDNRPNLLPGAPLIPANQSLRIKIANPASGSPDNPPTGSLDPTQTVVWYRPILHQPGQGKPSQFFGHGFGLAYRLDPFSLMWGKLHVTDTDLLDASILLNYHDLRWVGVGPGFQSIPTTPAGSDLARNRLGPGSPDLDNFTF